MPIELDPLNTDAGLMERLFLHETRAPSYGDYDRDDSLKAMRYMRQVLQNRLAHPQGFSAAGKAPRTLLDVVRTHGQFGGFESYPELDARFMQAVYGILHIANARHDRRSAANLQHVRDAILAATEASPPPEAIAPVVAWRTRNHGSPGANFVEVATLQGNTFFKLR